MRRTATVTLLALVALTVLATGCVKLRPDADPFLTRSEQALAVSVDTLDAFFTLEKANRAEMEKLIPGCHGAAENLRRKAPEAIRAATSALDAYRAAKGSSGSKPQVEVRIASLQALVSEVKPMLAKWGEASSAKGGGK